MRAFLLAHQRPKTLAHVQRVASQAVGLASRFGVGPRLAWQAGLLHDISAVIPAERRLELARRWELPVFPEEEVFPMLLHQRLSVELARGIFGIRSAAVLSAVECHTTLRPGAGPLVQVLFVADKIAWDQEGQPPYLPGLLAALDVSLNQAARFYLLYLRDHATGPLHPWARAALEELI